MYALIYTNPINSQSEWCVADIPQEFELEQYLSVVNLNVLDGASRESKNFKWVYQPAGISMSTHIYDSGEFVEISTLLQTTTALSA